jgi:hypothetical protein
MGLMEGGGGGGRKGERLPGQDKQFSTLPCLQVMFLICKQQVNYKKSSTKGSEMSFLA